MTTKPQYKKTAAEYAKAYDVSLRTIKNWKAKGIPLDDPEKVYDAVWGQRSRPSTFSLKNAHQVTNKRGVPELYLRIFVRMAELERDVRRVVHEAEREFPDIKGKHDFFRSVRVMINHEFHGVGLDLCKMVHPNIRRRGK